MTIIYLHFLNIPATPQAPFKVLVKGKQEFESTSDITHKAIQIDVADTGFASFVKVHLNFIVAELNLDELNQYNVTNNGPYFQVSVKQGALDIKQRFDDRFSQVDTATTLDETNKFYQDNETGEFVYSLNKPKYMTDGRSLKDPNYYKKEVQTKTEEQNTASTSLSVNSTRCYLHLSGIDATSADPFQLKIDGRTIFKSSRPIPKPVRIPVFIKQPIISSRYHEVTMRIEMPELGVETDHDFNLTLGGVHIQIAVINNIVEILQNKNGIFPMLTKIDSRYTQKEYNPMPAKDEPIKQSDTTTVLPSTHNNNQPGSNGEDVEVTYYLRNIKASSNEPFELLVNGEELIKTVTSLPPNTFTVAKCILPGLPVGSNTDHIVETRFKISSKGVDGVQQFNISRNGRFIMIEVGPDGAGGEKVNLKQQHKDTFGENAPVVSTGGDVEVLFFLDGLSASKTKPFSLLVSDQKIFEIGETFVPGNMVVVNGRLPVPKSGDHIVRVKALVPEINATVQHDLNLTKNGTNVKVEQVGNEVNVYQSKNDKFEGGAIGKTSTVPSTSSAAVSSGDDIYEQLEKLASLKQKGILTDAEFQAKKKQLLGL